MAQRRTYVVVKSILKPPLQLQHWKATQEKLKLNEDNRTAERKTNISGPPTTGIISHYRISPILQSQVMLLLTQLLC
jgi:hypothetical protein